MWGVDMRQATILTLSSSDFNTSIAQAWTLLPSHSSGPWWHWNWMLCAVSSRVNCKQRQTIMHYWLALELIFLFTSVSIKYPLKLLGSAAHLQSQLSNFKGYLWIYINTSSQRWVSRIGTFFFIKNITIFARFRLDFSNCWARNVLPPAPPLPKKICLIYFIIDICTFPSHLNTWWEMSKKILNISRVVIQGEGRSPVHILKICLPNFSSSSIYSTTVRFYFSDFMHF